MSCARFNLFLCTLVGYAEERKDQKALAILKLIENLLPCEEPGDITIRGTAFAVDHPPTDVPYGSTTARAYDASLHVEEVDIEEIDIDGNSIDMDSEFTITCRPLSKLMTSYMNENQSDFQFKEDYDDEPYDTLDYGY